jgi:CRP-like cAMP-binding protein
VILVLEGTLRVTRLCDGEEIVIAIRGPGDLLGQLAPLGSGLATASVEAREAGRVGVLATSRFSSAISEDPEVAVAVTGRLVELLSESDRRRTDALCTGIDARVATELLALAELTGDSSVQLTQSELASLCLASRSSVATVVAELRESGAIEASRGRVTLLDVDHLRHLAGTSPGS